jgi:deazaflavin-dependent oxidoreductase (nitroreductase family)
MPGTLADTHPPRGLTRLAARLPIWLYRARMGWLLGDRFLMLTHTGRKSGLRRQVVLEVVHHNKDAGTYVIASGWGEKSDWFRNIQKTPRVTVHAGSRRFEAVAVRLSLEEAERELLDYAQRHPTAFRELAGFMAGQRLSGTPEDCRLLARSIPLVILWPSVDAPALTARAVG